MHFNDAKARRELGYMSRPYREGIVDAIAWFAQAGILPRELDPTRIQKSP
jgi:dihydroflavonol-4-reductase